MPLIVLHCLFKTKDISELKYEKCNFQPRGLEIFGTEQTENLSRAKTNIKEVSL